MQDFDTYLQWFLNLNRYFGDGIDETIILIWLVMIDSIVGTSWRLLKKRQDLISQRYISSTLRNTIVAFIPMLIETLDHFLSRPVPVYHILTNFIFILFSYFYVQSICANLYMCGLKLPSKIQTWLKYEIMHKNNKL